MILLTGATGFLGKIILDRLHSEVLWTLGRSKGSSIVCDFASYVPVLPALNLVIHAAGKAHIVPKSGPERENFYMVNVQGTNNLLTALEQAPALPKSFVFISSVAVYGKDTGLLINEETTLSASDTYGISKIKAEQIIQEWCAKNYVTCAILRLPLIAGPNPPGNLRAMIHGIQKGYYFNIAGGKARKSIVLAEDVARIIPKVAEVGGIYNLTDGFHPSFKELSLVITKQLGKKPPGNIPGLLAKAVAKVGDILGRRAPINSIKLKKITSDLTFDDSKACKNLGWNPASVLEGFKIR